MPSLVLRSRRLAALAILLLAAAAAVFGAESGVVWPQDLRPMVATLAEDERVDGRALLLRGTEFLTTSPEASEGGAALLPRDLRGRPTAEGGLVIVQFAPEVAAAERLAILARHGAAVGSPIPAHARVTFVARDRVAALAGEPGVVWIGRLHPGFKLSRDLAREEPILDIHVYPAPGVSGETLRQTLAVQGVVIDDASSERVRARVESWNQIVDLARRDEVLFIEPAPHLTWFNDESRWVCQSGTPGSYSIHARGVRGGGQIVAVMDSGLEASHCCFDDAGKIADNRAWGGGILGPDCSNDHGTHVAGTALCSNNGSLDGLAPDARLILQDVGRSGDCQSVFPPNPLSSAWSDARNRGAFVHTNSWGGGFNSYAGDSIAIDQYMWNNQDFLILFAAGNDGPTSGTLSIHSNAKNSVTVGGSENGSGRENMYFSSSRGPAGDGRLLPDLTAPATSVESARSGSACSAVSFWGTSMATPAVAGSAALVREYFTRGFYPTGSATPGDARTPSSALMKAVLLASARDMTGSGVSGSRPNNAQGFGRLTLDDALFFAGDPANQKLLVLDDFNMATGFTTSGQVHETALSVTGAGLVKLMLVWTDAPGSFFASKALVNDLDLEVQTAGGTLYAGNAGFSGGVTTTPSSTFDRLNNKEAVYLNLAGPQTLTVRVRAHAINDVGAHPQDYALIAIGPVSASCDEAPPEGVGNSVRHGKANGQLVATWADRAAAGYVAYRGSSPDFFGPATTPYEEGITDENPTQSGVQWTDTGALADGQTWFYVYASANGCGDVVP